MEIVDDEGTPVFQVIYLSLTDVSVRGVFPLKDRVMFADESGWGIAPTLPEGFSLKPIFRYPSYKFQGEPLRDATSASRDTIGAPR